MLGNGILKAIPDAAVSYQLVQGTTEHHLLQQRHFFLLTII
jgi:hypothetical protein